MQPNHQTKTHRPNPCTISTQIQTLDNLGQYPSSFHPLSGGRITRNEQPPQQWLDARALNQPLVNLMSREAIVVIFVLGEVFAISWTIENWFVNHLPRKQERGSLVKDLIGAGQLYRVGARFTIHRISLYRILTTRSWLENIESNARHEGWKRRTLVICIDLFSRFLFFFFFYYYINLV